MKPTVPVELPAREGPGSAGEFLDSPSLPARRIPWLVAVAVVFAANLLWPRSYLIFGIDHLSFLPMPFQIAWTGLALAAIAGLPRLERARMPAFAPWLLAACAIGSFWALRTTLPGIHGDGESGGFPALGAARWSIYPDPDGRLQSFLNAGLSRLLPSELRFHYHFNALFQDYPLNASWILLTLLCGAALALFAAGMASRWRAPAAARTGLLAVALASPPMLNAYGHFDSYVVPVLCIAIWIGSLAYAAGHPRRVGGWAGMALSMAAAAWAHPILALLLAYAAGLLLLLRPDKAGRRIPLWAAVGAGIAAGLLPYAIGRGNVDYFRPEYRDGVPWLLHEKAMSCLSVALPAILLFAETAWMRRRSLRRPGPFQALAIVLATSSLLLCFTLWVGYGLRDEFLYSLFGALCLGGAVLLFTATDPDARLALAAAAFSLYLFVPKAWVYSGALLHERFSRHAVHDRCSAARKFSAYYLVAAATPVDSPEYRERKLALLEEGFAFPSAEWDTPDYRKICRAHYAAWCLEFGKDREGTRQLEWFLRHSPDVLPHFWRGNGRAFRTDHFLNRSPARARVLSRKLLDEAGPSSGPEATVAALRLALAEAEVRDPVVRYAPRPGTRESDLRDRAGEFWNSIAPWLSPEAGLPSP